ncbi:MAG TPA: serine/threonine-protein kinase, partial [Polyangiaceae bacterium]|nr:serine/threonine-protein kinase [Polyangiaceae bacterium]
MADRGADFAPGTRVAGRYVLSSELGKGGIGAVYRARDTSSERDVAFKVLLAGSSSREMQALFEREYHTLANLKHPRIIEVYEYGVCEVGTYYTMELLDGQDLRDLAPLPWKDACKYLRDVASSLALLHARRLLHRDLSPRNVRLTSDGCAKLLDFGALASFGWASEIIGTPPFVAPEALLGSPLDQRADLFALGALGYWLLTGRQAYPAKALEQLPPLWRTPVVPPSSFVADLPEALDTLILGLLRFDALTRPGSAMAVIDSLNGIAGLDAREHEQEAESYLASGALAGREKDLEQLRLRLKQTVNGEGSSVCIEGDAGVGKTRMLNELALHAQLQGATVLRVNAALHNEPLGVAKNLALTLLRALPAEASKHAAPYAQTLGHLSAELWEKLERPELDTISRATPEARASLQDALLRWILAVATDTPLLLAVDDVHAVDESSAALLAVLASEVRAKRLLLAVTFLRR